MKDRILVVVVPFVPMVWGSTYIVTTELLPEDYPLTAAMLRALPAGLILLAFSRRLPSRTWLLRSFLLGALNFSIFWWLLFVSAYSLPGGIAATVGAIQPILVLFLSCSILGTPLSVWAVVAGFGGIIGVALLVLVNDFAFSLSGLIASAGAALSMAFGIVLTKLWQPPERPLTFTAWQLSCGGLLLLPVSILFEPWPPKMDFQAAFGFTYLGTLGGAVSYYLWFLGIARLGPNSIAPLSLLSPITAVVLGWFVLDQSLSLIQLIGVTIILGSILTSVSAAQTGR